MVSANERAVGTLQRLLRDADYTQKGLRSVGVDVALGVRRTDMTLLRRAVVDREPLATLARMFLLDEPLEPERVERALGAPALDALRELELVERRSGRIRSSAALTPWREFVVAHDHDPPGELWSTHVAGPTPAAETLVNLIVPSAVDGALDLGTGSGLIALVVASRGAQRVIATDVNTRALKLAALNAALNDRPNIDVREGSFFEPVTGERFDLIVADPPFVISPERDLLFRYAGRPRDEVSQHVLEGSVAQLAENGIAQVLVNWIVQPGESWSAAPRRWLDGRGCDAIVLHHGTEDPLSYAVRWNMRGQQVSPDRHPATIDRWLEFFEEEGIEAIATGAVLARKRSDAAPAGNWFEAVNIERETGPDGGRQLLAMAAGLDFLAHVTPDSELLAAPLGSSDGQVLTQSLSYERERYTIEPATLSMRNGLGVSATVDAAMSAVLLRLDGERPLGSILEEVAAETGTASTEFVSRGLALCRSLLRLGLLAPPRPR